MCHGISMPIQPFPDAVDQHTGGTVKSQILHYNIAAQNGTWLAHQLVDNTGEKELVVGWFVCHSTVDPETEVDKILRVSGSPYECDSGSQFHNEQTVAEGILPINRYDWGYYDDRCKNEVPDLEELQDQSYDRNAWHEYLGLADYAHARDYIEQWKHALPYQRESYPHGIWMGIHLEYMFGRFGFNDEHTAARSFLWFTTNTDFTRTAFAGTQRTLRIYESPIDRFERQLSEGYNFEGIDMIQKMVQWSPTRNDLQPPPAELFGPYDVDKYILSAADFNDIRSSILRERRSPTTGVVGFAPQWKAACIEVLNEAVLSFLEKFVVPVCSAHNTITAAANVLFPDREPVKQAVSCVKLDLCLYKCLIGLSPCPEQVDKVAVGRKIREFLVLILGDGKHGSLIGNDSFVEGLVACVAFLMGETLELADNHRWDSSQNALVPRNIRAVTFYPDEIFKLVRYSRVYWHGGRFGRVEVGDGGEQA